MKKFNLCARARRAIWLSVSLISFGVCRSGLDKKRDQSAIGSQDKRNGSGSLIAGNQSYSYHTKRNLAQIQANGENGWVKLSSLRFGDSGNYRTSLSDLKTGRRAPGITSQPRALRTRG